MLGKFNSILQFVRSQFDLVSINRQLWGIPVPIFIGGSGGSGTRVFLRILQEMGIFMGLNLEDKTIKGLDSIPFRLQFARNWKRRFAQQEKVSLSNYEYSKAVIDLKKAIVLHREGIPDYYQPWGLKIPISALFLPFLHQQNPKMKFIHVVRDGRDMAFSERNGFLLNWGDIYLDDYHTKIIHLSFPVQMAIMWNKLNTRTADYGEQNLKEHYLRIRFEDLCFDPERILKLMIEFINPPIRNINRLQSLIQIPESIGRWKKYESELMDAIIREEASLLDRFNYR